MERAPLTHAHRTVHFIVAAGVCLALACSDDEKKKSVATCDPAAPACEDGLICAEQEQGDALCQIPPGGACDPGEDNPNCRIGSECMENPASTDAQEADPPNLCLVIEAGECDPLSPFCADSLSCAELSDGSHQCHLPVLVRGTVSDAADMSAIEGAHVIAQDAQGVAVTDIAESDADGNYSLEVPVVRDAEGMPTDDRFTLRAAAQDYQSFPGGLRTALPLSAADATQTDEGWVIEGTPTDITLIALGGDAAGRHRVVGQLVSADGSTEPDVLAELAGVLIVADGSPTRSAITDAGGHFTIFNVQDGGHTLAGYAAGVDVAPEDISVHGGDVLDVELSATLAALATVDGSVQIVNAFGGAVTSVILVVEDTFDDTFVRGETPRGLRAPRSGAPDVDGAFSIEHVPDGDYVVLAAFENDDLVRDPDTNIAGTDIVHITVAGADMTISESFKITEALAVRSPGADAPEGVSDAPLLTWADDSSEDYYQVVVYDAFGEEVWRDDQVPGVSGSDDVSVQYAGPMDVGMYYQFRVTSWRAPGGKNPAPISATEDLRGVFYVLP